MAACIFKNIFVVVTPRFALARNIILKKHCRGSGRNLSRKETSNEKRKYSTENNEGKYSENSS